MKYCKTTTMNHSVSLVHSDCIENINELVQREGHDVNELVFINKEICLNIEIVESKVAALENRNRNKSMDFAIGLSNSLTNDKEILLVELKLNLQNPRNIKKEELEAKVLGSSNILSNELPNHNQYLFIFKDNFIEQARYSFRCIKPNFNSNFIPLNITQFHSKYFYFINSYGINLKLSLVLHPAMFCVRVCIFRSIIF